MYNVYIYVHVHVKKVLEDNIHVVSSNYVVTLSFQVVSFRLHGGSHSGRSCKPPEDPNGFFEFHGILFLCSAT